MVEVSVPMVGLSEDEGKIAAAAGPTVHRKEKPDRAKVMTEFYRQHGIAAMVSRLIGILMRDKPADPIAHIVQHLLSPERGVPPCEDVTPYMDDASKKYLLKHKIHYLFDEFLNNMVDENPEDIVQYCMTWMRWNRKRFTVEDA